MSHIPEASSESDGTKKVIGLTSDYSKFFIYMVCLGISFGLFLIITGPGSGTLFWIFAGFGMLGIVMGALAPVAFGIMGGAMPQVAVCLSIVLALWSFFDGTSFVWPSALVLLFASRVLMELADLRFMIAWRAPIQAHPSAAVQSLGASIALGGFLTIAFDQLLALLLMQPTIHLALGNEETSAGGIIIDALRGNTVVHKAVVYLFFVVIAFIADAWRLYLRDKRALNSFAKNLRETIELHPPGVSARSAVVGALYTAMESYPGSWSLLACRNIIENGGKVKEVMQPGFRAITDFHHASRRFIKGLVPLLPLLGFVGTVIGLSITLSQLPHNTSQAGQAALDISASLGGLAIKFQTTLLGLVGGMIASTVINLLEKAETEVLAECALIVSAVLRSPLEVERVEE